MNIFLTAKMKSFDEFIAQYEEGDELAEHDGRPLVFYAVANNNTESRYLITSFLIRKSVQLDGCNECGENLLHVLLSRVKHDLVQTTELCARMLAGGADINQLDSNGRVPLQYLINMKYTDEELEPLYRLWLSSGNLLVSHKNAWGKSPLELAEALPYRESFYLRLKQYA